MAFAINHCDIKGGVGPGRGPQQLSPVVGAWLSEHVQLCRCHDFVCCLAGAWWDEVIVAVVLLWGAVLQTTAGLQQMMSTVW